jgi:hypothetical protein
MALEKRDPGIFDRVIDVRHNENRSRSRRGEGGLRPQPCPKKVEQD